jgi:hypothetical protein
MTQSVLIVFPINTGFKRWKERTLLTKYTKDKKNSQPKKFFWVIKGSKSQIVNNNLLILRRIFSWNDE